MKKPISIIILFGLFIQVRLNAEPIEIGPLPFNEGVNLQSAITNIRDGQSTAMCDCVVNLDGSISKRYGSEPYVSQPLSTGPVDGIYRAYASTGQYYTSATLAIIGEKIVYSSGGVSPLWVILSSRVTPGQNWSFVSWDERVIFSGDKLTDPIFNFNLFSSSLTNLFTTDISSEEVQIRAKHLTKKSNYLFFSNVAEITNGTTYYPRRTYYSQLNQPSSVTWNRYEEFRTGEEITGMDVMFDRVNIFFPHSIHEIDFTVMSPQGNQVLSEVVSGFGLKASRGLANIGQFYVFPSEDGIRKWDGGRRSRLNVSEESTTISGDIKILIDNLITKGTYRNIVGKYYKKREWYLLSYEDPEKFPKGANNSFIAYDLRLNQWYPLCGLLVRSLETFDGGNDKGELVYGSSIDGMIHYLDIEKKIDDSPQNLVVDTMDSTFSWRGPNMSSTTNSIEGNAAIQMWITDSVTLSSITTVRVLNLGEWNDKRKITKEDKLSFQVYPGSASIGNITSLRVDLEINDVEGTFDNNFTSVTLSSSALNAPNTTWTTVEILLSSFPILDAWTSLETEDFPFSGSLSFYGLRFVVEGVGVSSIAIDNIRIVQSKESPVNFYRYVKMFDFGTSRFKTMGQLILTLEKSADSILKMDIYNDFGKIIRTETINREIPRELIVTGFETSTGIAILDDIDFSIIRSTRMISNQYYPFNGAADKNYIYFSDRGQNRIVKLDRNNFSRIVSTFGSLGSGTTNFNVPHQMKLDEKNNIFLTDTNNNRIKIHSQVNLGYVRSYGTLGTLATSYHVPAGLSYNESFLTIVNEGNSKLTRLDISTLGFKNEINIDFNMAAEASLVEDEDKTYMAYNKISDEEVYFLDLILESRSKSDGNVINRIKIKPENSVLSGTYSIVGNIALRGRYIYICFSDRRSAGANYYIQKRLKKDFSLVKQYRTNQTIRSVIGEPFPYKPTIKNETVNLLTEGRYIQVKFYDEGLDNQIRLINQTYVVKPEQLKFN